MSWIVLLAIVIALLVFFVRKYRQQQEADSLRINAEKGEARSQYLFSVCHAQGSGVKRDFEKSYYWCAKAAEQDYAQAQLELGRKYDLGLGIQQDNKKAVYWYKKAEKQGLELSPLSVNDYINKNSSQDSSLKEGSSLSFGGYKWHVLAVGSGKALIIMEGLLTYLPFHDKNTVITWEKCSLRYWLNNEFYNSFSDQDKARIVKVSNDNEGTEFDFYPYKYNRDKTEKRKTNKGPHTNDYIFLLSVYEANSKYFKTDLVKTADYGMWNPDYADCLSSYIWQSDSLKIGRTPALKSTEPDDYQGWWLRSLTYAADNEGAAAVVNIKGAICVPGLTVYRKTVGVRPVLLLSL